MRDKMGVDNLATKDFYPPKRRLDIFVSDAQGKLGTPFENNKRVLELIHADNPERCSVSSSLNEGRASSELQYGADFLSKAQGDIEIWIHQHDDLGGHIDSQAMAQVLGETGLLSKLNEGVKGTIVLSSCMSALPDVERNKDSTLNQFVDALQTRGLAQDFEVLASPYTICMKSEEFKDISPILPVGDYYVTIFNPEFPNDIRKATYSPLLEKDIDGNYKNLLSRKMNNHMFRNIEQTDVIDQNILNELLEQGGCDILIPEPDFFETPTLQTTDEQNLEAFIGEIVANDSLIELVDRDDNHIPMPNPGFFETPVLQTDNEQNLRELSRLLGNLPPNPNELSLDIVRDQSNQNQVDQNLQELSNLLGDSTPAQQVLHGSNDRSSFAKTNQSPNSDGSQDKSNPKKRNRPENGLPSPKSPKRPRL